MFTEILNNFMFQKKPTPTPNIVRFVLAFHPHLADPKATLLEVGEFTLKDEKFAGFKWKIDYLTLGLDPLTESIFRMWPECMRQLVHQWPAFRNRCLPAHLKARDPDNIEDYIVQTLAKSSIFITRVEHKS